jgi:hypothetical protein
MPRCRGWPFEEATRDRDPADLSALAKKQTPAGPDFPPIPPGPSTQHQSWYASYKGQSGARPKGIMPLVAVLGQVELHGCGLLCQLRKALAKVEKTEVSERWVTSLR